MKNFCIYKKDSNLSFKKVEHIIPAGLGGTLCLPKGYVSDEVNEQFSALEAKALRRTLLAGIRNYLGPGHRGKMIVTKRLNPHMNVFKLNPKVKTILDDRYKTKMGFMLNKKTIFLPQITATLDKSLNFEKLIFSPGGFKNKNNAPECFFTSLFQNNIKEFTEIYTEHKIDFNGVIIGNYYDRWYIFVNNILFTKEYIQKKIVEFLNNHSVDVAVPINGEYDFSYTLNSANTDQYLAFIYAKTVFNCVAYIVNDKILDKKFDFLRKCILNNTTLSIVYNNVKDDVKTFIHGLIKDEEHIILFRIESDNCTYAYISFYGDWILKVFISNEAIEELKNLIFISDWKKNKDYLYENK